MYLAETNTNNIKYYFVIERIKYSRNPPINRECLTSELMCSHSSSVLNCTQTMMHLINKLDSKDANVTYLKENVDEIAKFSHSNIKVYRNIEIYSNLDNAVSTFNMRLIELKCFIDVCVDNINQQAGYNYTKLDKNVRFGPKVKLTPKAALKVFDHTDVFTINVRIDSQMLLIALNEIIANAYKFSRDNINVGIILRIEKENVFIVCSDEGIGFDKKALPDPFAPFAKCHKFGITADNVGLGLGLSIAKRIINHFDGDITYSNHKNKPGANVTVRLPIVQEFEFKDVVITFDKDINENEDCHHHSSAIFSNIFKWKY